MARKREKRVENLRMELEQSARRELIGLGVLNPGDQFALLFRLPEDFPPQESQRPRISYELLVEKTNQRPLTPQQKKLMRMPLATYFNAKRCIKAIGSIDGVHRLINAMTNEAAFQKARNELQREYTLGEFLENTTPADMMRWPNVGRKTITLTELVLRNDAFPLRADSKK